MIEVEVEGAENLATLARALKQLGAKDLRRELYSGIQRAAKPTKGKVLASARSSLPSSGGLAALVAASKVSTRTRATGKNPRVTIEARNGHDVRSMNAGRLRHPVFGTRAWVTQSIPAGWFSDPIEDEAPAMRREIETTMRRVATQALSRLEG